MSAQPSNPTAQPATTTESEKDPFQADLAAIMSEIDQLHTELKDAPPSPAAAAEAAEAEKAARPKLRAMTAADLEEPSTTAHADSEEEDYLAEFRDPAGAASLEAAATDVVSPAELPFGGPFDSAEPVAPATDKGSHKVTPFRADSPAGRAPQGASASAEEATLSMNLSGAMRLKLNYEFGNQQVTISFDDGGLRVSLADGTEFKIPTGARSGARKAA